MPAAGLGVRLLSVTKEQLKETLPMFAKDSNGETCLKPLLQTVFEQLYDIGFRNSALPSVGGEGAKDRFTQDYEYVEMLRSRGRSSQADDLESFYRRLKNLHFHELISYTLRFW